MEIWAIKKRGTDINNLLRKRSIDSVPLSFLGNSFDAREGDILFIEDGIHFIENFSILQESCSIFYLVDF